VFLEAQAEAQYVFFFWGLVLTTFIGAGFYLGRRGGHLACRYGHRDARRITYKKRHRAAQEAAREEEPEAELEVFEPEPEPERKGILDRIFRRGK
jgi:hypothetical protein